MVKVQVNVKNLAIDLDGKEMKFRQGDVFDIPSDKAERMGNTLVVLEKEATTKKKAAGK